MHIWKSVLILSQKSILEAIQIIDNGALQIALVIDKQGRLLGTVTDGDIRRGILKGIDLNKPVDLIMNSQPTVAVEGISRQKVYALMRRKKLRHIPIVDKEGILTDLHFLDELMSSEQNDNWVVLMAGGLGSRLRPLTEDCPKPLLKVGGKPVLETIMNSFIDQGFNKFFISVNYRAEMIEDYFGDGSGWGVNIEYLHEKERLGTAGALGLLPERPEKPVLVMNGDILTRVDFRYLLNFHEENSAAATMCVREHQLQVPYGVVRIDDYRLHAIEEKPVQRFLVNAGLYVLNPETLEDIPQNTYLDMPAFFEHIINSNKETAAFPIREYWIDIGHSGDYEKANGEYAEAFRNQRMRF